MKMSKIDMAALLARAREKKLAQESREVQEQLVEVRKPYEPAVPNLQTAIKLTLAERLAKIRADRDAADIESTANAPLVTDTDTSRADSPTSGKTSAITGMHGETITYNTEQQ